MRMTHTAVIYEAPSRVGATLRELSEAGAGRRYAVVARELTKKFEEFARGRIDDLAERFTTAPARGEVVILVCGAESQEITEDSLREHARRMLAERMSPREVTDRLIGEHGAARNVAYRLAHET